MCRGPTHGCVGRIDCSIAQWTAWGVGNCVCEGQFTLSDIRSSVRRSTRSHFLQTFVLSMEQWSDWNSNGEPQLDDEEQVAATFSDVSLLASASTDQGLGRLILTTRRIIWQSSAHSGQALAATFHSITMHAISHDSQVHQKGCIYAQLEPAEEPAAWAGVQQQQNGAHGSEEEDEEEDEEESTPEIRLVPQDESVLQDLFQKMCDCAALNPDSDQDELEGEGDFYYNEDEVMAGVNGDDRSAMLQHLDGLLTEPGEEGRFEDAEEDEEEPAETGQHHS